MNRRQPVAGRRNFLRQVGQGAAAAATCALGGPSRASSPARRPQVAAVFTEFRHRSHAHVILENFLEPYLFNGRRTSPGVDVVSFYADQFPEGDMARDTSRQYGIPIYPTIAGALCLGGDRLAVDAVLSIGEHGSYPTNRLGQVEYPRKRFFDEIVAVFEHSGRVAALFNDKHLSYRWDWAQEMYDTARRLGIPFLAGSSVPLAERRPPLELPAEAKVAEAVSVHGGPVESYDFHALEVLQSLVEFRRGGETGVAGVQFLSGDALWKAADEGLWSTRLAEAALAAELGPGQPSLRQLVAALAQREQQRDAQPPQPHAILVTYRDGLSAAVLKVGQKATRWNFACRLDGQPEPRATSFYTGPWRNRNLFKALAHAIQTHFRQRKAPYPVERTLLATGVLAAALESHNLGDQPQETPHLEIAYQPRDFRSLRERGDSWRIITEDLPEPPGINPGGT